MSKFIINPNQQILSNNLGVIVEDGKIKICYIDLTENEKVQPYACFLSNFEPVDPSKVTPISEMFYEKKDPDKGIHGDMLACIAQNENCQIFDSLKSDKSIVLLRKLSTMEHDIYWYNEDNGVQIVNTDNNKSFKIKDVLKVEEKVNKIEEKVNKNNLDSGLAM